MANQKLISIDIRADFAFFKKPDYNVGILLSYNMLHKPALLGILGAIIGLEGYQRKGEFPQYYHLLKDIPMGIEPLEGFHEKGNFPKTSVKYTNTVGYANADGNLLVEETMLIKPAYRCYLLLSLEDENQSKLYEYLKTGQAEYIPYFGKNEFQAWWMDKEGNSTFQEYQYETGGHLENKAQIRSVFRKTIRLKDSVEEDDFMAAYNPFDFVFTPETFMYFERLPADFNTQLLQYNLQDYTLSNIPLKAHTKLPNLYYLMASNSYVQLS